MEDKMLEKKLRRTEVDGIDRNQIYAFFDREGDKIDCVPYVDPPFSMYFTGNCIISLQLIYLERVYMILKLHLTAEIEEL
jgi:hypothetical protein